MKLRIIAFLTVALPCIALAQTGIVGTKLGGEYSVPAGGSSGVGIGSLVQMLLALAIVGFLLKTLLPKLAGKLNKKLVTTAAGGIQIEESAQFAGGSLYVVNARGRSLLLSVSTQGVRMLADVTETTKQPDPFAVVLAEASNGKLAVQSALDRLGDLEVGNAGR